MTLRLRFLLAAGLLVLALTAVGFVLIRTVETSQVGQLDRQLSIMAPIAAGLTHLEHPPEHGFPLPPTDAEQAGDQTQLSDVYIAQITGRTRQVIATPRSAGGTSPRLPSFQPLTATKGLTASTVGSVRGAGKWRAIAIQGSTGVRVLLAIYMGPVDATASELRVAILSAGGVMAVILVACGFWLERLGLRPIAEVTAVADAITEGDRSRRVIATPRGVEAAHLASAFNTMLDKQNAMLDKQAEIEDVLRRFVADASHELRTPLSVISGLTQLWREGAFTEGPALDQAMRRIGQQSNRMRALVEELLLLARLDAGTRPAIVDSEPWARRQ